MGTGAGTQPPPLPIRMFDAAALLAPQMPAIREAIESVLASGHYILGRAVHAFESAFADYLGVGHAVGVGNGSDALELALRAVGVEAGDRVLTVANAGGYASTAIHACAASALFVDIDPQTLLVDPEALEEALEQAPRACILTHLYGRLAAVERIAAACAARGVALIEDCAQAHGARRGGRRAGSFGAIGCFSFYPTKNLGALGDGGALVTDSAELAARLRALRQYGWGDKYRVELRHGRNSRLDEFQAAILAARLPALDADNARRRAIAARFDAQIRHPDIRRLQPRGDQDDVVHLYVLRSPRRDALRAHLQQLGIASEVHYPVPDHLQPAWAQQPPISLPHSEAAAGEVLSLPCHPAMTDVEVERVIAAVHAWR